MNTEEYAKMDLLEKEHFWFDAKRKYLKIILKKFNLKKGLRVLDVGCGTGAVLDFLKNFGFDAAGIDMSSEALKYCRAKNLKAHYGMADKIDFPDNSFDIIFALDVLEHLDDDIGAVAEVYRVLKKDGLFIATVPAHNFLWSYHDEALHHKRRYSKGEFGELIASKFKIKLLSWIHFYIFLPISILRIIKKTTGDKASGSDVKRLNYFLNLIAKICYLPELLYFKIFNKLPVGVSLVVVAKKEQL